MPTTTLVVAAVCFIDEHARVLTVRKRGTASFMLPGGKLEPGESPAHAAVREVREEVGIDVAEGDLAPLGVWTAAAANEPDTDIAATVYTAPLPGRPAASREIEELRWTAAPGEGDPSADLAPLLRERVFPAIAG